LRPRSSPKTEKKGLQIGSNATFTCGASNVGERSWDFDGPACRRLSSCRVAMPFARLAPEGDHQDRPGAARLAPKRDHQGRVGAARGTAPRIRRRTCCGRWYFAVSGLVRLGELLYVRMQAQPPAGKRGAQPSAALRAERRGRACSNERGRMRPARPGRPRRPRRFRSQVKENYFFTTLCKTKKIPDQTERADRQFRNFRSALSIFRRISVAGDETSRRHQGDIKET
jgi:hypothetical protein